MRQRGLLVALLAASTACAPKIVPAPVVVTPKFPDFLTPTVPASYAESPAAISEDRGWRFLQAGDLANAEREFALALRLAPEFYPAEASLGYLELARKNADAALAHFDRALARQNNDVPALVGRGQALVILKREADAAAAFEAALAVDPTLGDIRRRVEVLRFHGSEEDIARARQAARAGRPAEAIAAFTSAIQRSPESAFLYRELAAVERQERDDDRALEHFRRAVELDASDARSLVQIGEILESRGDFTGAERAYQAALAIEPGEALSAKLEHLRIRVELARLPEEYRAIAQAPLITRADLAALIGVRLAPLLQVALPHDAVLITDVRNHWALTWILAVTRAGVMEPFANHTFQPRAPVRRIDLAEAAGRLLGVIAARDRTRARAWESARERFSDLSAGHLAYPAASAAVAAGVLVMGPDTSFQPSKLVSGPEALAAIDRIQALAGPLMAARGHGGR
jgi:tetratricopeptide (TPR) repeat protein